MGSLTYSEHYKKQNDTQITRKLKSKWKRVKYFKQIIIVPKFTRQELYTFSFYILY